MGAPGPQTPTHNAYRVHFRSPALADRSARFLSGIKVAARSFGNCGGNFFDATVAVLEIPDLESLELRPDSPCLALARAVGFPPSGLQEKIHWPDLWIVEGPAGRDESESAEEWLKAGAGAVSVSGANAAVWESRNGAFGKSGGRHAVLEPSGDRDSFTAGLLLGLLEDLLGETLFDKTVAALDRECLEMRPLRLGRAVECGLAAFPVDGSESGLGFVHRRLREWRGPVPSSWGGRTR